MNSITADVYTQLVWTARKYLPNNGDADDAVQQALTDYYANGAITPHSAQLVTYLTKLVMWRCLHIIQWLRIQQKYHCHLEDTAGGDPAPEWEIKLDVHAALASLPTITRQVVILRLIEEKTMVVVARELHLSPRSCDRRLQAGREKLRRKLHAYAEEFRK